MRSEGHAMNHLTSVRLARTRSLRALDLVLNGMTKMRAVRRTEGALHLKP